MEELRCLGDNVYMAYGNVVRVKDPDVDAATEEGRVDVLSFAKNLFGGKFSPRPWGPLTAGVMLPKVDGPNGKKHVVSCVHFSALPDGAKDILRKELPEYADQI